MTKIPTRLVASLLIVPATLCALSVWAAPSKKAATRLASLPKTAKAPQKSSGKISTATLPRYVSMATIKKLQKQEAAFPGGALQPMWQGQSIKTPMRDLLTGPSLDLPPLLPVKAKVKTGASAQKRAGVRRKLPALPRFAQAFPRPIAPASPAALRAARNNAVPKWVRYPLEFQLAGIGLGTRAVDKDRFNRIDRYGLFALHGNPTAVVRSIGGTTVVAETAGVAGAEGAAAPPTGTNLTMPQTPPETAALFPQSQLGGGLPDWALAVTVKLDNNHVEWLYKRDTYSMGFVVDRLGFVDAIIVAGLNSDITRTQLEDPIHTLKLGDDLRKVMFRYGYPDDVVPLAADPAATANDTSGAPGGGAGGAAAPALGETTLGTGGGAGDPGATVDAGTITTATTLDLNGAYRTYDLRYEQSYNVVFTIRNNRVVRIYIFGDPDFFNAQRRQQIRTKY